MSEKKILLVYNAKSDFWNKKMDFLHKMILPKTYPCNLCKLTHKEFAATKIWTEFIESSAYHFRFLYKDQFLKEFEDVKTDDTNFPAIYLCIDSDKLFLILSGSEISKIVSDQELISKLNERLTQA